MLKILSDSEEHGLLESLEERDSGLYTETLDGSKHECERKTNLKKKLKSNERKCKSILIQRIADNKLELIK